MDSDEDENPLEGGENYLRRCRCRQLFTLSMPGRCDFCGEIERYWRTSAGQVLTLDKMKTEHLVASIKMLARKMDGTSDYLLERYEIAIDLLYEELGSRDKEITQLEKIRAVICGE
jgi:hypothetical protein